MEKRMNKKGGMEWYIIGFLIALGMLAILFIGPGKFLLWISNLFSYAPEDLDSMSLACGGYVTPYTPASYCKFRYVKINDIKQYANCEHSAVQANLVKEDIDVTSLNCGADAVKNYCIKNKWNTPTDKHIVNGVECKIITSDKCAEQPGEINAGKAAPCIDNQCADENEISGTFSDVTEGYVCCKKNCE